MRRTDIPQRISSKNRPEGIGGDGGSAVQALRERAIGPGENGKSAIRKKKNLVEQMWNSNRKSPQEDREQSETRAATRARPANKNVGPGNQKRDRREGEKEEEEPDVSEGGNRETCGSRSQAGHVPRSRNLAAEEILTLQNPEGS